MYKTVHFNFQHLLLSKYLEQFKGLELANKTFPNLQVIYPDEDYDTHYIISEDLVKNNVNLEFEIDCDATERWWNTTVSFYTTLIENDISVKVYGIPFQIKLFNGITIQNPNNASVYWNNADKYLKEMGYPIQLIDKIHKELVKKYLNNGFICNIYRPNQPVKINNFDELPEQIRKLMVFI